MINFSEITFPIYGIATKHRKIYTKNNILYIDTASGTYILDNRNISGNTLGERRVRISEGLYRPRATVYGITQLVRSKYKYFIDNTGKVFKYTKEKFVPLKYYIIDQITEVSNGCVIHSSKAKFSILVNCREAYLFTYMGILHMGNGDLLYELTDIQKSDTRRKI